MDKDEMTNQEQPKFKVGLFGLGKMGTPMAKRLLTVGGYPLIVSTRTLSKAEQLRSMGAEVAKTPKELAEKSDVVITAVLGDPELKEVYLGANGILKGARRGLIAIDITTVTPMASSEVAKAAEELGVRFLRAPVSGSTVLAERGELTFFVSGPKDAYESMLPIFNVLGKRTFYMGGNEESRVVKLIINMMVAATPLILAEALSLGEKYGMDRKLILDALRNSIVWNVLLDYKYQPLLNKNYAAAFSVKQMEKDINYALEAAEELGVVAPVTALVRQFLSAAEGLGLGEMDYFSLVQVIEKLSNIQQ
ncbi:MAG: NAD(P)-dependent oxidoreductase [Nitrososphaeria archaeon]